MLRFTKSRVGATLTFVFAINSYVLLLRNREPRHQGWELSNLPRSYIHKGWEVLKVHQRGNDP